MMLEDMIKIALIGRELEFLMLYSYDLLSSLGHLASLPC